MALAGLNYTGNLGTLSFQIAPLCQDAAPSYHFVKKLVIPPFLHNTGGFRPRGFRRIGQSRAVFCCFDERGSIGGWVVPVGGLFLPLARTNPVSWCVAPRIPDLTRAARPPTPSCAAPKNLSCESRTPFFLQIQRCKISRHSLVTTNPEALIVGIDLYVRCICTSINL